MAEDIFKKIAGQKNSPPSPAHEHRKRLRKERAAELGLGPDSLVWHTAAWWRDMDPFVGVVALTKAKAESEIKKAMREEARLVWADGEAEDERTVSDYLDMIHWPGKAYQEKLGNVVSEREMAEAIDDLAADGYYYPQMP